MSFARSECDPLQLCFGARRRFLHAASLMRWSLARGCSRTGNSNVHRLVVQGKHRCGEVEQALAGEATDYFLFWYSVSIFFQRYMCFSSMCCRWLIFSPVVYSVGCRQRAYSARSDIMVGTVPSIARLLLQVSFVAYCELTGSSVSCWQ